MTDSYFDPNIQYGNSYSTIDSNPKVRFNTPIFTNMQIMPGQNTNLTYNSALEDNIYDNKQDGYQFMPINPPPGFIYGNPMAGNDITKKDGPRIEEITNNFDTFSISTMSKASNTTSTPPTFLESPLYDQKKNVKLMDASPKCDDASKIEKIPNETKIKIYLKHLESLPHDDYHLLRIGDKYNIDLHTYTSNLIITNINVYQSGNCKFDSSTRNLKKYGLNYNSFTYNLKDTNNKYPICNSFAIIGDVTINTLNNICDGYDHILHNFANALIFCIEQPSPVIFAFDPKKENIKCEIVGNNKSAFSISSPCTTMIGAGISKVIIYNKK